MTVFNIGNICKEIQRIQTDIEDKEYESAIDRCNSLDDLLCDIEDGKHQLIGDGIVGKVNYGTLKPQFTTLERVEPNDYSIWYHGEELSTGQVCYTLNDFVDKIKELTREKEDWKFITRKLIYNLQLYDSELNKIVKDGYELSKRFKRFLDEVER